VTSTTRVRARAHIDVMLRPEIADPQGQTVERALPSLGWDNVAGVRIGKRIELELSGDSIDLLSEQVDAMCRALLANPVIERYAFSLERI
jgi:phosphoribosylformylglycinamidine synthase